MENNTVPQENQGSYPVKVQFKLKRELNTGQNEWRRTISGKDRLVTCQNVQLFTRTLQEAIESFVPNEVEEVSITASFPISTVTTPGPRRKDLSPYINKPGIIAMDSERAQFTCTILELYPDDTALVKVGRYLSETFQGEHLSHYSEVLIPQKDIFLPSFTNGGSNG